MRRRKVLIHVDLKSRDAIPMLLLKSCLEQRGCKAYLCNRITWNNYFYSIEPDVFVQSHIPSDTIEEARRKAKIAKLVVLPTEGAYMRDELFPTDFGFTEHNEIFSKVLVWGSFFKRKILENGYFDEDRVRVVGSPRLDVYRNDCFIRKSENIVGFVGSFVQLNAFDRRSTLLHVDQVRTFVEQMRTHPEEKLRYFCNRHAEDLFWIRAAEYRIFMELFDEWFSRREEKCVLRAHPNEYRESYDYLIQKYNGKLDVDKGEPLFQWLARMSGLVMTQSTTSAEAVITKTPFMTIDRILGDRFDEHQLYKQLDQFGSDVPFMRCALRPTSVKEATELMEGMCLGDVEANEVPHDLKCLLRDLYDWPRERDSIEDVADEIETLFDRVRVSLKQKNGKSILKQFYSRIKLVGRYAWHWISYVVSRSNYNLDQNYYYFPWNLHEKKRAKIIWKKCNDKIVLNEQMGEASS